MCEKVKCCLHLRKSEEFFRTDTPLPSPAGQRHKETAAAKMAAAVSPLHIYSATAALSASTRSVFSQETPRSSRPMWP